MSSLFTMEVQTRGLDLAIAQMEAVARTIDRPGVAGVQGSKRLKMPWDTARTPHGNAIMNMLAKRSMNPLAFWPSASEAAPVLERLRVKIELAMKIAEQTGAQQSHLVHGAMGRWGYHGAAQEMTDLVRHRVSAGKIGANTDKVKKWKTVLVRRGRATAKYGVPPPYGVRTGRMIDGLAPKWRPSVSLFDIEATATSI